MNTSKVLVLHSHYRIYSGTYLSCRLKSQVCLSIYLLFLVNIDFFLQVLSPSRKFIYSYPSSARKALKCSNVQHSQGLSRKCRILISDLGLATTGNTDPELLILSSINRIYSGYLRLIPLFIDTVMSFRAVFENIFFQF